MKKNMLTTHSVIFNDSRKLKLLTDESVDLVVTSPPYPMIEMWDRVFSAQNEKIHDALKKMDGPAAFELMHQELDKVWEELFRVIKPGGLVCINVGDATRTMDGRFALYTNHSRIYNHMQKSGFSALPGILWRKQTNSPNKFMGSGMIPPGAYVTLEHEYVLILRKGNKKEFKTDKEKKLRRESSFFWEERNIWFSDIWTDLKGTTQNLSENKARQRSAAFPFELPYRLITMFSVKGDTILDPFLGIGTTMDAAMAACRNSIGYEIDGNLKDCILSKYKNIASVSNTRIVERLARHCEFIQQRFQKKSKLKHMNKHYLFPVVTSQETDLIINELKSVRLIDEDKFEVTYSADPQKDFVGIWKEYNGVSPFFESTPKKSASINNKKNQFQQKLFENF